MRNFSYEVLVGSTTMFTLFFTLLPTLFFTLSMYAIV